MKVALFTDFYFEDHPIATVVRALRKKLKGEGVEVYVLTAAENSKASDEEGVFSFTSANIKRYPHFKLSLSPFLSAKKIIRGLKVDVIHNFAVGSMGAAAATCSKDLKLPSVNTIIELLPYTYSYGHGSKVEKFMREAATKYVKWLNSFFSRTTFPSQYAKSLMKEATEDVAMARAEVIPLPAEEGEIRNTNRVVGYVGNIERHMEVSSLLNNCEAIRNKTKKELKIFCTNNASNGVESIAYGERWKAYGKCATYIDMPNYSAQNVFANEFLQSGKPIVAPRKSPLAEVLERIDPLLVFEEKYVSESVQHALENSKDLKEKFNKAWEEISSSHKEYLSLYKEIA